MPFGRKHNASDPSDRVAILLPHGDQLRGSRHGATPRMLLAGAARTRPHRTAAPPIRLRRPCPGSARLRPRAAAPDERSGLVVCKVGVGALTGQHSGWALRLLRTYAGPPAARMVRIQSCGPATSRPLPQSCTQRAAAHSPRRARSAPSGASWRPSPRHRCSVRRPGAEARSPSPVLPWTGWSWP